MRWFSLSLSLPFSPSQPFSLSLSLSLFLSINQRYCIFITFSKRLNGTVPHMKEVAHKFHFRCGRFLYSYFLTNMFFYLSLVNKLYIILQQKRVNGYRVCFSILNWIYAGQKLKMLLCLLWLFDIPD